ATEIMVNQQQPSAGWFRLGAFSMAPGQNHHVEVAGALEGVTVADAIRFVSAGVSAPGITYVHADHLGSPQKMTDANKTIVWDAVFTPFGQVHGITGSATNNQRFPGQYFDVETGFNYNYFRDYDPTTGRYIESDPRGINLDFSNPQRQLIAQMGVPIPVGRDMITQNHPYGYVNQNPVIFYDPTGEYLWIWQWGSKLKNLWNNLNFDGPSAGLSKGAGRVCGVRFKKKIKLLRIDYAPYPGTNDKPRLHGHIGDYPWHVPLDPRSFFD
ncbi:MAG: RHS repeat-associated core domain-containing protein, partial [Nitrospirales bacterium]